MARIVSIDFNQGLLGPNVSDFGGFSQFDFPDGPGTASVESGFGRDGGYGLKIFTNSQEVDDDGFTIVTGYTKSSLADIGVHAHPMRPQAGDDWWYSFSFKIGGSAWSKGKGYEPIIWQARSIDDADGTNAAFNTRIPLVYFSIDDPGTAPLSASDWYRTSTTPKLFLNYLQPNTQGTSTNHYNNYSNFWHYTFLGNLAFETWYDVKFRIVWSASSNGSIQAWLKSASQAHFHNYPNVQIEDIQNIPVVGSETGQNYIKVGYEAYLNNASVNDYMKTTLYFDNILAGNDEEDVDLYTDDDSVISFRTVIYPYEMSSLAEVNTPVVAGGSSSPYILKNAPVNEQVGTNFIKPGTANQILTTISGSAQWSNTNFITDNVNLYVGTVDTSSQTRDKNMNYLFSDFITEGIVGTASFLVSPRGAGSNMSVDVAAGTCWIKGDGNANIPVYRVYGTATTNIALATANPTNPRNDIIIASGGSTNNYSGLTSDWSLSAVTGTPAGSPGTPSTPTNAILLAVVNVPAAGTAIGTAQITDSRQYGKVSYIQQRFPTVLARRNSTFPVGNATWTAIEWDAEEWDTDGMHETSVNPTRFTIKRNGLYQVIANYAITNSSGGEARLIGISKNGDMRAIQYNKSLTVSFLGIFHVVGLFNCIVGDYIEIFAYQDSGGSLNILADADEIPSRASVTMIAEAP